MATPCGFKGCSNQTYLALPACGHCGKRMCTTHLLPEVHGCGDAEKNVSQRQATADAAEMRRQRKHIGLDDAKAELDRRRKEFAAQRQKKSLKGKRVMDFLPASRTSGDGRDVFINHDGAYWLNPVPQGKSSCFRSARTTLRATDIIDPFGKPKQPDMPNLFGVSRYGTTRGKENITKQDTVSKRAKEADGAEHSGGANYIREEGNGVPGADACTVVHADREADGAPIGSPHFFYSPQSGTHGNNGFVSHSAKEPYSTEELICDKLPLDTADPERRVAHPGNHTERILPTGGSEYNGTVQKTWTAPSAVNSTYLRLAPLYESTTHYQLRTGLYYTEDEAPAHGMTLPPKTSLIKREW